MSVVPYFFVRCKTSAIAAIKLAVQEIYSGLEFECTELDEYGGLATPVADEKWYHADMGVGAYGDAAESEIAKRLYSHPEVIELRWASDMSISDGSPTQAITKDHRLIVNNGLEFKPRSWMLDENGRELLDDDGKPLSHLDYRHKRMALLAQAFNAVDDWLTEEQWAAVDEWMKFARLGGMR